MSLYVGYVPQEWHVYGVLHRLRCPDVGVMGPRPAHRLPFGFTLGGTLLPVVLQAIQLPPGAPGGQRAAAVVPQPGRQWELWREEGMNGQRLGGMWKQREAAGVVPVVLVLVWLHERYMVTWRRQRVEMLVMLVLMLTEVVRRGCHKVLACLQLGSLRWIEQVVTRGQVDLVEARRV